MYYDRSSLMMRMNLDRRGFLRPLDLFVTNESEIDAMPELEPLMAEVSGKDGSYLFGYKYKDRYIDLNLISEKNYCEESLRLGKREFSRFFDPKNGWIEFTRDVAPGFMARVRLIKSYKYAVNGTYLQFDVSLLMEDGVFKSIKEHVITGNKTIYNDSDVITPVELVCLKNGSSKAVLRVNDKIMKAPSEMGYNINSKTCIVHKNGLNKLNEVEGEFLYLEKGKNEVSIPDGWELRYREWRWF